MIIEVCAESYEYAIKAEMAGAHRIELCKDLHLDGLTPNYLSAKKTINKLSIPVFILIRPRDGNFVYSDDEFELMKDDISKFKEMGCKGIVSGILNSNKTIDIQRTKQLVKLSKPIEFTFHRAFDMVTDPQKELENLIELGVERVLTSGQKITALKGLKLLKELKVISKNRIKIMPGGGIKRSNILNFKSFDEIHGSFKKELNSIVNKAKG